MISPFRPCILLALFALLLLTLLLPPAIPAGAETPVSAWAITVDRPATITVPASALSSVGLSPTATRITRRGQCVAHQATASGITFVGEANDSRHTRQTTYWLQPGDPACAEPAAAPTLTWEVDDVYRSDMPTLRGDRWFAAELRGGSSMEARITLPQPLTAGASFEIAITPLADGALWLTLAVDGQEAGSWARVVAEGEPQAVPFTFTRSLAAGDRSFTLTANAAVLVDYLAFPSVPAPAAPLTITDLRPMAAHDLRSGPEPGVAGADSLFLTTPELAAELAPLVAAHQAMGRSVAILNVQDVYDAFSAGERDPEAIRSLLREARETWLPAPSLLLLIGAGNARMRGGDPPAATDGLKLSDGVLADPIIPPYLIAGIDPDGEIACDTCYARLDADDPADDPVPDLMVGRLPVRNAAELAAVVAKTVGALTAPPPGAWQSRAAILVDNDFEADGTPDEAGSFVETATRAAAALNRRLSLHRFFYAPDRPSSGSSYANAGELRCELFRLLDGGSASDTRCPPNPAGDEPGAALLMYIGHASEWQWGNTAFDAEVPYLFYLYDVDGRSNGARLPIVLSATCRSGNTGNPYLQAQDARMVLWPDGGAVASLSATGSGVNTGHATLLESLLPVLTGQAGADRSLGAAHLAAVAALPPQHRDLGYSFQILGDPLVSLPFVATEWQFLPLVGVR